MAELLSFRQREPQPVLRSNNCLMRARAAALRPSPPQVYQEMIFLPMEKLGGGHALKLATPQFLNWELGKLVRFIVGWSCLLGCFSGKRERKGRRG